MKQKNGTMRCGPRRLPIAQLNGVFYYVDERLKQFREVTDPHNYVDFDTESGRQLCNDYYSLGEDMCAAERIINMLKKQGWIEQKAGTNYINGITATNLFKDGEVITIRQDFFPDEEFIEQQWGSK